MEQQVESFTVTLQASLITLFRKVRFIWIIRHPEFRAAALIWRARQSIDQFIEFAKKTHLFETKKATHRTKIRHYEWEKKPMHINWVSECCSYSVQFVESIREMSINANMCAAFMGRWLSRIYARCVLLFIYIDKIILNKQMKRLSTLISIEVSLNCFHIDFFFLCSCDRSKWSLVDMTIQFLCLERDTQVFSRHECLEIWSAYISSIFKFINKSSTSGYW